MQEIGPDFARAILETPAKMDACDVLCFVYDLNDPNSFSYLMNLRVLIYLQFKLKQLLLYM